MFLNFLTLAALTLGAAVGGQSPPPSKATPDQGTAAAEVSALWVRADHLDFDALEADLALRLVDIEVVSFREERPTSPGLVIFVDVTPAADTSERLTLVVSDGRAYDRTIEGDAGSSPAEHRQLVARSIASLVDGVQAGTEPPDRDNVPLPEPERPAPLVCPAPEVVTPPEPDCLDVQQSADGRPAPRFEVGPSLTLGTLTGLGPPADTDRFAAFSGALGLSVRWRRGAMLVAGVRVAGRSHPLDSRLIRVRAKIGGGYGFRPSKGSAEIIVLAGASVEPWFVFRGGDRVSFGDDAPPAVGGWARAGVGYLIQTDKNVAVRLGSWVELAASYVPSDTGPIARISGVDGDEAVPMFRVGGPELALGLGTTIWFGRR